jgi:lycopene beta-cyclase
MPSIGIRGAGLAGFSLAAALKRLDSKSDVALFDRRPRLPHPARTFCFFDRCEDALPVAPAHRWGRVRFAGQGFERTIECNDTPYTMVQGDDFFAEMLPSLEAAGVRFFWEQSNVALGSGEVRVGDTAHRFDCIVDAAFDSSTAAATLWQSFGGRRITTTTPIFDPATATLMDLGVSSAESPISFMYVLPFSATEALIEHTTFSLSPRTETEHQEQVTAWLRSRGIMDWREIARERGAIPMGLPVCNNSLWPSIGTAAGGVRAGTGYGFVGIQAQATQLSEAIVSRGLRAAAWRYNPTPLPLRVGDALFLRALRRAPLYGADIMGALLRRARDRDLVAFLGGTSTLSESLRVMQCVPKRQMVAALWC